jgi:V/A-type H+-transporting ATPase subunit I
MFRAQPLYCVTLWCLASEAPDAALLLARHGIFSPVAQEDEALPENPAEDYRDIFLEADARMSRILEQCGLSGEIVLPADAVAPNLTELKALNDWLREIWHVCSRCRESELRVEEEKRRLASLKETYDRLKRLNLDLSRLLRPDSLLDARLGQVPSANVRRLRDALALAGYVLSPFDHAEGQTFAVVAGPRREGEGIAGLLSQAGWRELPVPAELQTHPDAARAYIEQQERHLEEVSRIHCQERAESLAHFTERVRDAHVRLSLARPLAEAAGAGVRGRRHLAVFTGWMPRRALETVRAALEERFHGRYWLAVREPTGEELDRVPSLLTYPRWLEPFLPLVRSYGVPRYGEFDPTLLFAVSYVLLFGAMFGDVGHGAVIMLLASFLRGRYHWLRVVGMCAGASSVAFGFLYGSVFGYEELIHPLWQSPLHDPAHMLALAVAAGVGFICVTLVINIYNRLVAGRIADALLDGGGLAGLVFYLAAVAGLHGLLTQGGFGLGAGPIALAALVVVALHKWVETRAAVGERLLVTVIESLETATNLFANTLSFLRVAAFSLNHVALALAVFTLAGGMSAAGHWLTILLGNAVIIVLEGGIVAIQALRLMYYEGFSRFFSGSGVEFTPLKLAGGER